MMSFDDRRNVIIPGDSTSTIAYSAKHLIEIINAGILSRGKAAIALSGGSTPKSIYQMVSSPEYQKRVDWSKVFYFGATKEVFLPMMVRAITKWQWMPV